MAQFTLDAHSTYVPDLHEPAQLDDEGLWAWDLGNGPQPGLGEIDSDAGDDFMRMGLNDEPAIFGQAYWRPLHQYNPDDILGDEIHRRHNDQINQELAAQRQMNANLTAAEAEEDDKLYDIGGDEYDEANDAWDVDLMGS